jgi:hypothetical protein
MIELRNNYFAVEVPDGATGFETSIQDDGVPCYAYWLNDNIDPSVACLPSGTWQIVCTFKDVTWTQATQIVEFSGNGFKDYDPDNFHHDLPFMSPFESLRSLLTVRGCDVNKDYLIIKKG